MKSFRYLSLKEVDLERTSITSSGGFAARTAKACDGSSRKMDYEVKPDEYRDAGVREYWIVDPAKQAVTVHVFERMAEGAVPLPPLEGGRPDKGRTARYTFEEEIPCHICPDLKIRISDVV